MLLQSTKTANKPGRGSIILICPGCVGQFHTTPKELAQGRRCCSRACQKATNAQDPNRWTQERRNAWGREWRANHPGKGTEYTRKWVRSHREQKNAAELAWRKANPEIWEANQRAGGANHRAKVAGVPGKLSRSDITALWQRQPTCLHCGIGHGVDHIIALRDGGTNTPDNLQNLCRGCNARKGSLTSRNGPRHRKSKHTTDPMP